MNEIPASEAASRLDALVDEVSRTHEPVLIVGEFANAVLVGEGDWRALHETLHIQSVPGLRDSILEGMACPVEDCEIGPVW